MRPKFVIVAALLAAGPPAARADVLYATGFEAPAFIAGQPVAGQDGWGSFPGASNTLGISTLQPQSGAQALRIDGSGLVSFGSPLVGAEAFRNFGYDPLGNGTPVVSVRASVRLDGPSTDTGGGINDDLISANLDVYDETGFFIAGLILSSNGTAYAFADAGSNGYNFGTPAALGQYHTVQLDLDFATRTTTFFLDGQRLGSLGFGSPPATRFGGVSLTLLAFDDPVINPAQYTASYDNFSVSASAVPEPASAAAFGAVLVGLAAARRRKRRAG